MADDNQQAAAADQRPSGQLAIQKIYVKDSSFEAPNVPAMFSEQLKPSVDINFNNRSAELGENNHEVVLGVTVTVKQDDRTVYLVEVAQAGIFTISGFGAEHVEAVIATACLNILFPYARETVSDLIVRGGFPQLLLAPVNFEQLYAQEMQRRQQAGQTA